MDSSFILDAIRNAHPRAAIVPEAVISDNLWDERTGVSKPSRRIDALMFSSLQRTAIEIKISKADLLRDTYMKRAPWMAVTHRFVYAMPRSLYESLGPLGNIDIWNCGIWTVDDGGRVATARRAVVNHHPEPLPLLTVQALAYRAARMAVAAVPGGESNDG